MSPAQRAYFTEVCALVGLVLLMPNTNAVSERSFSAMRRLKSYLRSIMLQSRLNHVMLMSINKDRLDLLDLNVTGDDFVRGSEHRLRQFGYFQWHCIAHFHNILNNITAKQCMVVTDFPIFWWPFWLPKAS